jgi:hypothetical protein
MRNIKISLETATRWYNGQDQELKDLAVQTYPELAKKELPKSWDALEGIRGYYVDVNSTILESYGATKFRNRNLFATKEQAEASIALAQLSQLLAVYNDGWVPDWSDAEYKYIIKFADNEIYIEFFQSNQHFLSFKTAELRDEFLTNFKDLILTAKPLL